LGQQVGNFYTTNGGPQSGKVPPLGNWESNGNPAHSDPENVDNGWYLPGAVGPITSPRMRSYLQDALGREAEFGFAAVPL
jgi:hypothetical protein